MGRIDDTVMMSTREHADRVFDQSVDCLTGVWEHRESRPFKLSKLSSAHLISDEMLWI
jgi:hypothetical protein